MSYKAVPFKRELHYGMGKAHPLPDVVCLQRALHKAKVRPLKQHVTGVYGNTTRAQVRLFQAHAGIRGNRGVCKKNTWDHLNQAHLFDGYSHWLIKQVVLKPRTLPSNKIDLFVKFAWWYLAHAGLDYYQQRAMVDTAPPPNVDTALDCSEFIYVLARAAGLPDPSGYRPQYQNWGNTYSFLAAMPRADGAKVGRLAFYSGPSHVAVIAGYSRSHGYTVIGMGSDGGPRLLDLYYRSPTAYRTFEGMAA